MVFEGKTVVITGAGSGVGRGLAVGFSGDGAYVVGIGRTREALERTAELCGVGRMHCVVGDVARGSDVERLFVEAIHRHEEELIALALEKLSPYRLFGLPEKRGSIIAFGIEGLHPLDIGTLLNLKGIALRTGHLCAQPAMNRFGVEAMCRLSLGLYNDAADIERLSTALPQIIKDLS